MKKLKNALILLLALATLCSLAVMLPTTVSADDAAIEMTPMYGEPFRPDGVTFGRVSFLIPDTPGLTKDGWDSNIEHNEDLILISYVKDGVTYEHKTIKEIKAAHGNKSLMRTCYTYDDATGGMIRLNLVFHMDDHDTLKPEDITLVTVKKGFVWCVGSPSGITGEMPSLTLDRDISFFTGEAGITAVKTGNMGSEGTSLHVRFERKDEESLKAISAVDLCPSAVPGKTLGDLVTIGGETVTELVKKGNVARFNFYGDSLVFHVDDPTYLAKIKNEHLEFVVLPGFRWMNWHQDDWGNWAGTHKDDYVPVEGTLVTAPISFYINEVGDVCVVSDGISVKPGYKDTYYVGDKLDMTTLLINVNYADGRVVETPVLEKMCEYDFSKPGQATVTVTALDMTTSFTVTVFAREEVTDEPVESEPVESEPETNEPETNEPETNEPETNEPETNEPETNEPETNEPETNEPDVSESEKETSAAESTAATSETVGTNAETTTNTVAPESGADTSEASDGCASSVATVMAILGTALAGAVLVLKKEKQ